MGGRGVSGARAGRVPGPTTCSATPLCEGRGPGSSFRPAVRGRHPRGPGVPARTQARQRSPAPVLGPRHPRGPGCCPWPSPGRLGSEPADGRLFLCLPSSSQIVQILPGGLCSPAPPQPPPQGPRRAALPTHEAESPRMPGLTSRHLHGPGAQPQGRGSSDPRVSKVPGRTVSSRWSEPSARHHGSLGSKAPRHEQRISR